MGYKRTLEEQMSDIACTVAGKYAARCWWAERQDLVQQAWVVLLDFRHNWAPRDEQGEIDRARFGHFAYRAAMRQLSRYLWRASSPVSLCDHACTASVVSGFQQGPAEFLVADSDPADERFWAVEARQACRLRVLALCGGVLDPWMDAALAVVVDGEPAAVVAERMALPSAAVRRQVAWVRSRVCSDAVLRRLIVHGVYGSEEVHA